MTLFTAHKGIRDSSVGSAVCVCVCVGKRESKYGGTEKMRAREHVHVHWKQLGYLPKWWRPRLSNDNTNEEVATQDSSIL